jgi:hypothetical protein
LCAERAVQTEIKRCRRLKHRLLSEAARHEQPHPGGEDPAETVERRLHLAELARIIREELTVIEREALWVAVNQGITSKRVDTGTTRARRKLRAA